MANHCWNEVKITWDNLEEVKELYFSEDYVDIFKPFKEWEVHEVSYVPAPWSKWWEANDVSITDWVLSIYWDSAWAPADKFLERISWLHNLSIELYAEESWIWFEINAQYKNWDTIYEEETEYKRTCEHCDYKDDEVKYYDEQWIDLCDKCHEEYGSACCWAEIINWICMDCKEHAWLLSNEE